MNRAFKNTLKKTIAVGTAAALLITGAGPVTAWAQILRIRVAAPTIGAPAGMTLGTAQAPLAEMNFNTPFWLGGGQIYRAGMETVTGAPEAGAQAFAIPLAGIAHPAEAPVKAAVPSAPRAAAAGLKGPDVRAGLEAAPARKLWMALEANMAPLLNPYRMTINASFGGAAQVFDGVGIRPGLVNASPRKRMHDSGQTVWVRENALGFIEKLIDTPEGIEQEANRWISGFKSRSQFGKKSTVLEHTALTYTVKSAILRNHLSEEVRAKALETLKLSWLDLTGKIPKNVLSPLPKRILRAAGREAQVYHFAAFQPLTRSRNVRYRDFLTDYVPQLKDIATAILLGAAAFTTTGGYFLAGAAVGFTIVMIEEALFHEYIGHASPKIRTYLKGMEQSKFGFIRFLGNYSLVLWENHSKIHHGMTFKGAEGYTTQFRDEAHKREVDAYLDGQSFSERFGEKAGESFRRVTNYGLTLSPKGFVTFLSVIAPTQLIVAAAMNFEPVFTLALVISGLAFPFGSGALHPYLHKPRDQALRDANPLMRLFLRSRWAEMLARLHYIHHREHDNFNLFYGGDYLLGTLKRPNLKNLVEMQKLGIIGGVW